MRIGELSRRTGVSTSRIRFYETEGLLPRVPRSANGYRDYPAEMVGVLTLIDQAQALGFSLDEIGRTLPAVLHRGFSREEALGGLEAKLAELDAHIAQAIAMRDALATELAEQRRLWAEPCAPDHGPAPWSSQPWAGLARVPQARLDAQRDRASPQRSRKRDRP
ncbi:MerR family transcriptional regulator [Zavarzinia sp. CC-PAN008]|uniref:MerR family transcriptional regulator n=1 Tax=Zavarzinia sp. CC-PAN008 TaxID=3243332 RepID=UPI003F7427CD